MPPTRLDPSRMSDQDLYTYVESLIVNGYQELPQYVLVIPDILTAGIVTFSKEQQKARRWADRILQMLQDIRNVSSHVSRIAKGKERLFENAQAVWLQNARNSGSLKGLDATERRQLARLGCDTQEQEIERWEAMKLACKNYVDHLKDKLDDLERSKQELRSQLWAVRVHGVLGELGDEARDGKIRKDPPFLGPGPSVGVAPTFATSDQSESSQSPYTPSDSGSSDPTAARPDDAGPTTSVSPADLDALLGEIQEEREDNA